MKYIAFLRGINVGGRVVKMAELKACFEEMGFEDVKTVLQTGNVVFEAENTDAQQLKPKIEAALTKTFNYPAKILVYRAGDLKKLIDAYPLKPKEGFHDYIVLMADGLAGQLFKDVDGLDGSIEQIALGKDVIYWQVQKGMTIKSQFSKNLTKAKYKDSNTVRNLNTLKKLSLT